MTFQIKDYASIVAAEVNHARAVTEKITDFQPGSVARTLLEAPAVEVEQLYLQMFLGLRDAIPVSTFQSFGFDILPAARAVGWVSVSSSAPISSPITIPLGTQFSAPDGRVYESLAAVTWAASTSIVRVQVRHTVAGAAGNISAGGITTCPLFGAGYVVSNAAITTGRDVESDAEREARFADFIKALSRGTIAACIFSASSAVVLDADGNIAEYVTRVGITEVPGIARIYIYTSAGIPSASILLSAQSTLDGSRDPETGVIVPGVRPAGVRVDVLAMSERAVPFSIQVQMLPGYSLTNAVVQALGDVYGATVRGVMPGVTLHVGSVVDAMLDVAGVRQIVPSSNANIVCAENEALVPGTFTATAL